MLQVQRLWVVVSQHLGVDAIVAQNSLLNVLHLCWTLTPPHAQGVDRHFMPCEIGHSMFTFCLDYAEEAIALFDLVTSVVSSAQLCF